MAGENNWYVCSDKKMIVFLELIHKAVFDGRLKADVFWCLCLLTALQPDIFAPDQLKGYFTD